MQSRVVDFLTEDPEVYGQRYALISIVGPHMKQKCDVWGLKIRGVADSVEKAKEMTKKLMKFDKDYDIYTVDVGKFFPLNVEPYDVQDIEYENDQLNALVKNYLSNKEKANEHWNARKEEMKKDALKEGSKESQAALALKPEHPVAVLQRVVVFEEKMKELEYEMSSLREELDSSKTKFESYSEEEKEMANTELKSANKHADIKTELVTESVFSEMRDEIEAELKQEKGAYDSLFE